MRFKLPLYIVRNHKGIPKKYWLNFNQLRTWHRFTYIAIKNLFNESMIQQLKGKKFKAPIKIHYYYNRKKKSDPMNALALIDKFFCDALVKHKCIEDDNYNIVKLPVFHWLKDEKDVCYASIEEGVEE